MSSDLDKFGRSYQALLELQRKELKTWKRLLTPEAYSELAEFCEMVNGPAGDAPKGGKYRAGGLHTVPVGCELHHFLMRLGSPKVKVDESVL